jgi:hypothetical protein
MRACARVFVLPQAARTPQPGKVENTWQSDETFAIPRMGMDVAWTGCVIHGWAWMDVDSSLTTRYMLLYVG